MGINIKFNLLIWVIKKYETYLHKYNNLLKITRCLYSNKLNKEEKLKVYCKAI